MTEFREPIEIIFSNPTGVLGDPGVVGERHVVLEHDRRRSTARRCRPRGADGFYRDSDGVHVLTRHLTFFGLMLDDEAPTDAARRRGRRRRRRPDAPLDPRHRRERPARQRRPASSTASPTGTFGPTEFEAKLGAFAAGDTRTFTLVQRDAAGNVSAPHARPPCGAAADRQEPRGGDRRARSRGLRARQRASRSRSPPSCPARSSARPT